MAIEKMINISLDYNDVDNFSFENLFKRKIKKSRSLDLEIPELCFDKKEVNNLNIYLKEDVLKKINIAKTTKAKLKSGKLIYDRKESTVSATYWYVLTSMDELLIAEFLNFNKELTKVNKEIYASIPKELHEKKKDLEKLKRDFFK